MVGPYLPECPNGPWGHSVGGNISQRNLNAEPIKGVWTWPGPFPGARPGKGNIGRPLVTMPGESLIHGHSHVGPVVAEGTPEIIVTMNMSPHVKQNLVFLRGQIKTSKLWLKIKHIFLYICIALGCHLNTVSFKSPGLNVVNVHKPDTF